MVRKPVTVLFSDWVDSAKLGRSLEPESTRQIQELFFDAMADAITRHGGTIEQFAGDGIYAVFGIPVVHEDDALRAVRAAIEMRERMATLNEEIERRFGRRIAVRTGVNTGEVAVGIGKTLATGTAVVVGRRLETAAPAGGILLGLTTYRLVRRSVRATSLEIDAKGFPGPLPAFRLEGLLPDDGDRRGQRRRAPMVGRAHERDQLLQLFARCVRDRACQLVTVAGPPGVGKSRLVEEVVAEIADRARCLAGRSLPYGEGITFWPLAEIVRQAFDVSDASAAEARQKIALALRDRHPDEADGIANIIARLIGIIDAPVGPEEGFRAIRKLFEALAADRPLIVVFDDVQWAEPTFLDLIEHLADWAREAPLLLVCMARSELYEERPSWGAKRNATSIMLGPLGADEAERLINGLLDDEIDRYASVRIAEAAEGNPLFVEEILEMLVEDGLLVRRSGKWSAATELSLTAIPPTIHALLAARIEQLAADDRIVLECAAVEGTVFHRGAVEDLADGSADVGASLLALVRKEMIRDDQTLFPGDDAFRFRHVLIRDAAYQSLAKQTRAALHQRYAAWLDKAAGGRLAEVEEITGHHLEQAHHYHTELGRPDELGEALAVRAAEHLASAGRRALSRSDRPAGINLLERASALLSADRPRRAALLPDLGTALTEAGRLPDADRVLSEAAKLARVLDDERLQAHATVQQLKLRLEVRTDSTAAAVRVAEHAVEVFERSGDHVGLCRARRLEAWVHWIRGRAYAAEEAWRAAAANAEAAGAERDVAEVALWLATAALFGPISASAGVARCETLLGRLVGRRYDRALLLYPLAGLQAMLGRLAEARSVLAEANAVLAEFGVTLGANSHVEAFVAMLADDPVAAERCLRADYETLEGMGAIGFFSTTAALLARAVVAQERLEEAYALTEVSERSGTNDDLPTQMTWRGVRARVLAARGRHQEAERLAREAVAIGEQTDWLTLRADALVDLGVVRERAGRVGDAVQALDAALALYERKANHVAAAKTRSRLVTAVSV